MQPTALDEMLFCSLGRKSKPLQLRRQRKAPKSEVSGESLQNHETTMESTLDKSNDSVIQDICLPGKDFPDKHPLDPATEFDVPYKPTESNQQLTLLTPISASCTHASEGVLDITDLHGDLWSGSDPSSPSLLSQQKPLLSTPPPSTSLTPASTNSPTVSNTPSLTQQSGTGAVFVPTDKTVYNSSFLHRKRKGVVEDDLCLPVSGPKITSSPTNDGTIPCGNCSTIVSQSHVLCHTKSMHVIPPTPWHRPTRPSMLSNLLLSDRNHSSGEELRTPEDFEEQLSEEILPAGERVIVESLAEEEGGDYEDEMLEEEMEEDPEMTRPFFDTLHTITVGEDADVTRSLIPPVFTTASSSALNYNTPLPITHTIPPVSTQTSISTITSAKVRNSTIS